MEEVINKWKMLTTILRHCISIQK